ncbi:MAG: YccF domain-containing protein [Bacteroidales bacterium]|nr:YccF domain-containing protein [Bacteroidales bacterium]
MKTIGNILWVIFGGLFMAIEYFFFGLVLCLTLIGIPFGLQVIKLASLAIWPFGRDAIHKEKTEGCLTTGMNILWIFLGGIETAISHAIFGVVFFITIIGIPFGKQHFKLAAVVLTPFGREIVNSEKAHKEDGVSVVVNITNNQNNNTSPQNG